MASIREKEVVNGVDEKLYVAVGKEFKACKSTIVWALQNSRGKKLCLAHVHQPAQYLSILGGRFPISSLSEQEVMAHRDRERQVMSKTLDEYQRICTKAGVQVEKTYIEMDTVESGLVELISQHKIGRLVMGAAADNRYSRKMMEPKSKKANYLRQHSPDFCHIFFVCKGRLIHTREGIKMPRSSHGDESSPSSFTPRLTQSSSGWSASLSRASSAGSFDDLDESSTFSLSNLSIFSRSPVVATDLTSVSFSRTEDRELSLKSLALPPRPEEKQLRSPPLILLDTSVNDNLYHQLDQTIADAEIAKREAFDESMRRRKAEKEAIEALRKANTLENAFNEELKRRKEIEEELARTKEELERTKKQRDMALEDLKIAMDQNSLLSNRSENSDVVGRELEDKLRSTLELLQSFRQL